MLIEPDIVLMERRSWRRKVPVTLWDMWLMTVERDMMSGWSGDFWVAVGAVDGASTPSMKL